MTDQLVNVVALPLVFLPAESLDLLPESLAQAVEPVSSLSTNLKLIVQLTKHRIRANLMAKEIELLIMGSGSRTERRINRQWGLTSAQSLPRERLSAHLWRRMSTAVLNSLNGSRKSVS